MGYGRGWTRWSRPVAESTPQTETRTKVGSIVEFVTDGSHLSVAESFDEVMDRLAVVPLEGWPVFTRVPSGRRVAVNPANVESVYDMEAPDAD